jgi:hypothetical protein
MENVEWRGKRKRENNRSFKTVGQREGNTHKKSSTASGMYNSQVDMHVAGKNVDDGDRGRVACG